MLCLQITHRFFAQFSEQIIILQAQNTALREDERDLQAEQYDLLIDLTTRYSLPLRYLAMLTKAHFKVGLNLGEGLHDMLLSLPDFDPEQGAEVSVEATWLYNEIMKYITTIKSND